MIEEDIEEIKQRMIEDLRGVFEKQFIGFQNPPAEYGIGKVINVYGQDWIVSNCQTEGDKINLELTAVELKGDAND